MPCGLWGGAGQYKFLYYVFGVGILIASFRLSVCMSDCLSVCLCVGRSVGRSVGHPLLFFAFLSYLKAE